MPEENINLTKEEYKSLVKRLEQLEGGKTTILKKPKHHYANLRTYNKKYVTGLSNVRETVVVEEGKEKDRLLCTLTVLEGKEQKKIKDVDYLEFLRKAKSVEVKILNQKVNNKEISHGLVEKKNVQYDKYRSVGTGVHVPMEEIKKEITVTVETPEGGNFEMDSNGLNI